MGEIIVENKNNVDTQSYTINGWFTSCLGQAFIARSSNWARLWSLRS